MTKDKYFDMCEQMGIEPLEVDVPIDMTDLPYESQVAIHIFNLLGDRMYPEIGYIGKDYTNLNQLIQIYEIEDKELLMETLHLLDSRAIKISADSIKKQYDKLKRGSSGR